MDEFPKDDNGPQFSEEEIAPVEILEVPPAEIADPPGVAQPFSRRSLLGGVSLVVLGVLTLLGAAIAEVVWMQQVPWSFAVLAVGDGKVPEGGIRVQVRRIPAPDDVFIKELQSTFLDQQKIELESSGASPEDLLKLYELPHTFHEHVLQLKIPPTQWESLLGEGRIPKPGKAEVLAGDMADQKEIVLDGVAFTVVGSLKRGVGGSMTNYYLPQHKRWTKLFQKSPETMRGWILPEGLKNFYDVVDMETLSEDAYFVTGNRTHAMFIALGFAGLILVAVGGCIGHIQLFWYFARRRVPYFSVLFHATAARPRLFYWCHVFYFGLFFVAMYQGFNNPLWSMRLMELIGQLFTEGDLSYIGEAYSSGNYLWAAVATWWNNYMLQTLLMTFAISLIPIGLGLLKTAFSFVQVGFAMPPVQVGSTSGYSYHSITMILELEAYIVACFAVIVWTQAFYRSLFRAEAVGEFVQGTKIMLAAALLCGFMLAFAGLYEAVTIITFSIF